MNCLVIGGTGLISGGITRVLKRRGHRVTVYHRGRLPLRETGVMEILGDRQNRGLFEATMKAFRWDAVFDLISFSREDAASAHRAFAGRVKHFLHCSTVCAVGVPTLKLVCDEDEPYHPISGYGRGKRDAELYWLAAWRRSRFPVTIFRPSHTYGPGGGWVLGTFMTDWEWDCELANRIRRGAPVVVHGDGEAIWQSCYVDEVALGFVAAAGRRKTFGQVYNVCGRDLLTWNEYYVAIGRAIGRAPRIVHVPTDVIVRHAPESATGFLREIAQFHGAYSTAKLRRDVPEFDPRIGVEEGTRRHLKWLKGEARLRKAPPRPFEDRLARLGRSLL